MTLTTELRARLQAAGQGHTVDRLDGLAASASAADRELAQELGQQLAELDLELLAEFHRLSKLDASVSGEMQPPELFPLERDAGQEVRAEEAIAEGERLLRAGRVAFVLVAGGQSSRLGYDAPKGDFPLGPVTNRTLFGYHAARLRAATGRYGKPMPWYVMTSRVNDAATRASFAEAQHFGLSVDDVFFFSQEMQPALDAEGRVLFSDRGSLFLAPNGHGGCLLGLQASGALADMRRRGIEYVSYFQVDNPLVRPTDPLFLGLHALAGAGMSSKVVEKHDPDEKVGVLGLVDNKLSCIEYSDLPGELREDRNPAGKLSFRAGNIAVHVLSVDFLESVVGGETALPWHVAAKRIPSVELDGSVTKVPGFKFETFVFDALASSPVSVTLEVERALEFSPVKNKEGDDSPATSRAALCSLFAEWVRAAGGELPEACSAGDHPIEVDPCFAETQDEFIARFAGGGVQPDVLELGHLYEH